MKILKRARSKGALLLSVALILLCAMTAAAQSATDKCRPASVIPLASEPPAKLFIDPPLAGPLAARGERSLSILIRKWTILDKKKKKGFIRTVPPCHFKLGAFVFPWREERGGRQMRPRDGHPENLCHRWTCAGKPSEPFPFFSFLSKIVHLLDEIARKSQPFPFLSFLSKIVHLLDEIARALIEHEFRQILKINKLAVSVNLSDSHFRHLFKRETGTTLAQYVLNKRMNEARNLLDTTYLSVKEVMNLVGICDDSHFAHCFRAKYGTSASQHILRRLRLLPSCSLPAVPSSSPANFAK